MVLINPTLTASCPSQSFEKVTCTPQMAVSFQTTEQVHTTAADITRQSETTRILRFLGGKAHHVKSGTRRSQIQVPLWLSQQQLG